MRAMMMIAATQPADDLAPAGSESIWLRKCRDLIKVMELMRVPGGRVHTLRLQLGRHVAAGERRKNCRAIRLRGGS